MTEADTGTYPTDFEEAVSGTLSEQIIGVRRAIHKYAEPGWCEVYTATKVVQALRTFGWDVRYGAEVIAEDSRLGLPAPDILERYFKRAIDLGADPDIAARLRNGLTGVVAVMKGAKPGPVVAFRFDMDANYGAESSDPDHYPVREGFASINSGVHHNCGHDGHTSIGLAVAREIASRRDEIAGEIRLIFQPAEEGLRGARSMVAAGVLEGVDYFLGCHLGVQALALGEVISGYDAILGSVKLDIAFQGRAAHAAISPHLGCNAIMAACAATQALMALPRHGAGDSRINVGLISGGTSRNTIPAEASIAIELRADNPEVLNFLKEAAEAIFEGVSRANSVSYTSSLAGESCPASSDSALSDLVAAASDTTAGITKVREHTEFRGSEDAAEMMQAVQDAGGKAAYFGIGTELKASHHNSRFDFDEAALRPGVDVFLGVARMIWAGSE